mgnify:CR=1 FL=1
MGRMKEDTWGAEFDVRACEFRPVSKFFSIVPNHPKTLLVDGFSGLDLKPGTITTAKASPSSGLAPCPLPLVSSIGRRSPGLKTLVFPVLVHQRSVSGINPTARG